MNFNSALKRFLFRIGSGVRYRAHKIAPVGPGNDEGYNGGNLKKDIKVFDDRSNDLSIGVGNSALVSYAKFVYFGTRPHVIKPKKMKALANKKSGQIFGKSVNHPGTKANPYLEKAFSEYVASASFVKAKEQLASDMSEEVVRDIKVLFST
ncbi:HK97 gp10 family phage protein [uncultured Campylobacter sp.]|uniref:HK97 gp10 family phage protein n=1 Tax=uncultured Campylobacter sp. TaxID=218934 RepID=UPI002628E1F7|nr:HK97 gp10 family phage protein [uncultured Campylobacter sp.]